MLEDNPYTSLEDLGIVHAGILSSVGEGVSLIDTRFMIHYQNPAHKSLMGSHEGDYCYRAYQNRSEPCEDCPVRRCFAEGRTRTLDRFITIDGRDKYLRVTASPLRNSDDEVVAATQVVIDISKQKYVEQELQEANNLLFQVADNMEPMMYLLEADFSKVKFVNKAYENIWGRPLRGLYENPMDWMEGIHPDDRGRMDGVMAGHKGPKQYASEYRIVRPDGEVRHIIDKWFPIFDAAGRHIRYAGIAADVTAQKVSEQHIYNMHGMMRHDVKGFLAVIHASAEMLAERASKSDMDDNRIVSNILRNTGAISGIVDDMMVFSNLQQGKVLLNMELVDPYEIVLESVGMYRGMAESRGIKLVGGMDGGLPKVMMDSLQLQRAVMNLVQNAVNYSPEGSTVTVAAAERTVGGKKRIGITVTDDGPGIPPDERDKVFDVYYRSPSVSNTKGSGLGLPIARLVAEAHGGTVSFECGPGGGCEFTLLLPWPS